MVVHTAGLIYFSPTHTTKRIIAAIAQGVQAASEHHIDLTPPETQIQPLPPESGRIALIGAPVYAGRLPRIMVSRFRRLDGRGTPAVIVVVYGNRAYEDALLELRELAVEVGFQPFAAGAFIGEHSYSAVGAPIAVGRPDAVDLAKARAFGVAVREKATTLSSGVKLAHISVPGNSPYKEHPQLPETAPVVDQTRCTECGECVTLCPVGAIHQDNPAIAEKRLCIRCCACVKSCPTGARAMDDPRIRQVTEYLRQTCGGRKEPETFL